MSGLSGNELGPTVERPWAPGMGRGVPMPWWAKLLAKQVLARAPLGYRTWARLGLFRHGRADLDPDVPIDQFESAFVAHVARADTPPRTTLEMGPGDALGTALAGAARGVTRAWLVDTGDFATRGIGAYRTIAARLAALGRPLPQQADLTGDRDRLLASLGARYLTDGVNSLAAIPDASVGLAMSFAVLEHVRRAEMPDLFTALFRVTAPGGTQRHFVDLSDHLGGGLNHLRFPSRIWEAPWFAPGLPYTNRMRHAEIVELARSAGFVVSVPERLCWDRPPLPRQRLAREYRDTPESELRVAAFVLALRRPA